jgi:hypothetical protein
MELDVLPTMCGHVNQHYALKQHRVLAGAYPVVIITEDCVTLLEEFGYNTVHQTISLEHCCNQFCINRRWDSTNP